MKIAVIDMGTNTFHLIIAEVTETSHEILHKERVAVKIGENGITKGIITDQAWIRALSTISSFKETMDQNGVKAIFATATSAVRNASNGEALTEEIKKQTGIETKIISGEQEAKTILNGVKEAIELGDEKSLIMDIGGGSIEFIIANQDETFWLKSFEVGGQRLVEKFHNQDPISQGEDFTTSIFPG